MKRLSYAIGWFIAGFAATFGYKLATECYDKLAESSKRKTEGNINPTKTEET